MITVNPSEVVFIQGAYCQKNEFGNYFQVPYLSNYYTSGLNYVFYKQMFNFNLQGQTFYSVIDRESVIPTSYYII